MKKEIGKWFLDIAKYVATAVIITTFLSGLQQKWVIYVSGFATIAFSFTLGLFLLRNKKINSKK